VIPRSREIIRRKRGVIRREREIIRRGREIIRREREIIRRGRGIIRRELEFLRRRVIRQNYNSRRGITTMAFTISRPMENFSYFSGQAHHLKSQNLGE